MADKIPAERRSYNMSRIRAADTGVEMILRRELRARGVRGYRVHPKGLPGKPDIVFTRWKVAVFVDGCFWHACERCFVAPSSNTDYWRTKIARNVTRDREITAALRHVGWRVLRIWEHEIEEDLDGAASRVIGALRESGAISR